MSSPATDYRPAVGVVVVGTAVDSTCSREAVLTNGDGLEKDQQASGETEREPQRPPAVWLRPPQTQPDARHTQQRAMPVLEQQQEPLRRRPGPSALRRRCRSLTIAGHILELELLA
jgi:hypothetical protein